MQIHLGFIDSLSKLIMIIFHMDYTFSVQYEQIKHNPSNLNVQINPQHYLIIKLMLLLIVVLIFYWSYL